jgi:uncharacterized ion transporter superfamily protein YfcC
MSFWASVFGASNTVSKGLDLIDEAFYTDDERSERKKELLKAYEPFKLAQRMLAFIFCIPFVSLVSSLIIASFWIDVTEQLKLLAENFSLPIGLIVGFYFAGGVGEGLIDKYRNKK